jgi:quinol monooxygenase YgiN
MSQNQQNQSIDQVRADVERMLDRLGSEPPIAATVVFQVDTTSESTFLRKAEVLTEATRKVPGMKLFGFHKQIPYGPVPEDQHSVDYLIYENWVSVAAFRVQWESHHLKHFQYTFGDLLVATPDLDFYTGSAAIITKALVLKTGLTRCWDTRGDLISCLGTGQDGAIQAGAKSPDPRFTDQGNGAVADRLTGLIWLKNANAFGEVTWENALAYARSLASGGTQGLNDGSQAGDWRLPNIRELLSLVDYNAVDPILPPHHPFLNVQSAIYWTSTSLASAPVLAWMTTLGIAPAVFDFKATPCRMWPVRGKKPRVMQTGQKQCWDASGAVIACAGSGQDGEIQAGVPSPAQRFTDNGDGTVSDNLTSLVWTKNADPIGYRTWAQALIECNKLGNGYPGLTDGSAPGDWRLPNVREMESLVDYGNFAPSLPTGNPFTNIKLTSYWTSTTVSSAPTQAMFVILGVGPSIFENKEVTLLVWPVRDTRPV